MSEDSNDWCDDERTYTLYQVIGSLAEIAGIFDDPHVIRALDLAAYGKTEDGLDVLPFQPKIPVHWVGDVFETKNGKAILVPLDDLNATYSDSLLPAHVIFEGADALRQCREYLNNYEAGKTIDWDYYMEAVRVYRVMTGAFRKNREI